MKFLIACITLLATPLFALAETLTNADEIVRRANLAAYYAGNDGRSEARMRIVDQQGREQLRQFTILRRDRVDGGDQDFMVFFSRPSDIRGTVFLVAKHAEGDDDRWLYLPGLDLIKRIAAGDKRTSFVGSHYFYEDVSGRNPSADNHQLVSTTDEYYVLRHTPLDPDSVEFVQYDTWIDRTTFLPMKVEYQNSAGDTYRRVEVLETEMVAGFPTVSRSRISDPLNNTHTEMEFRFMHYDLGLPDDIFSERYLRNPPREWLKRSR